MHESYRGGIIIPERYVDDFLFPQFLAIKSCGVSTQAVAFQLIKSGAWNRYLQEELLPDGRNEVSQFNELMDQYLPESKQRDIRGGHFGEERLLALP